MKNTIIKNENFIFAYDTDAVAKYCIYETVQDDVVGKIWTKREYNNRCELVVGEDTSNDLINLVEVIIAIDKISGEFADAEFADTELYDEWCEEHKFTIGMGNVIRKLSWNPASANELNLLRQWLCYQVEYELSLY